MIPAEYYKYIYIFIVTVMTLSMVGYRKNLNDRENMMGSILLCSFLILFVGFRPHSAVFGDTINYSSRWGIFSWDGFSWEKENKLFDNLLGFMESVFPDATYFFVIIAAIYFILILITCRKLFPSNTLITFLVYLGAFSTFTYGVNGIKAGAAASLFLCALAYRDNMKLSIFLLLLSLGFHHSMQLPVAAYILTLFFKDKKWYFYGWAFCLLMAVLHVSFFQVLFASMADERGAEYLLGGQDGDVLYARGGFRLDFILYSTMPVLMGYYVKYKYQLEDKLYDIMLHTYLTCNGIWMLCMYAEFTNRIAYLSWFMYPIVLIYPCYAIVDENHPLVQYRKKIVTGHLAFTLFMELIYY